MENKPIKIQGSDNSAGNNQNLKVENEWETFLEKISGWLVTTNIISRKFDHFLNPSILIISSLVLLVSVKAYTSILHTLEKIPFASSLFEVLGTLWLIRFSITHLLRKQDRQQFTTEMKSRWINFSEPQENKH